MTLFLTCHLNRVSLTHAITLWGGGKKVLPFAVTTRIGANNLYFVTEINEIIGSDKDKK